VNICDHLPTESETRHCETHDQVGLKMESETAGSQTGLDIESGTPPDRENIESSDNEREMITCLKSECQGLNHNHATQNNPESMNYEHHEISNKVLECHMKNEDIPILVNSDEEFDSSNSEDGDEEQNHDNLKQNHSKTSDEIYCSIDIYITDARILTEIDNILQHNKITCQSLESIINFI